MTTEQRRLMTVSEAAALLGIAPQSVRKTLRRAGITEVRGYPRAAVERLASTRAGRPAAGRGTARLGAARHG